MSPNTQRQVCTYGKGLHRDGIERHFPILGLQNYAVAKPSTKRSISSFN